MPEKTSKINRLFDVGANIVTQIEETDHQVENMSYRTADQVIAKRNALIRLLSSLSHYMSRFGIEPDQYAEQIGKRIHPKV